MLEQIYNDFVSKVLPTIHEGLILTKDYFYDVFGRYVKYLIVMDIVSIVGSLVGLFVVWRVVKYCKDTWKTPARDYYSSPNEGRGLALLLCAGIVIPITLQLLFSISNLAKTVFVPEIRVYQEVQSLLQNKHDNK